MTALNQNTIPYDLSVDSVFGPSGVLSQKLKGRYEQRDSQVALANTINQAFEQGQNLIAEAPCGTGKSFAYLVPAAILCNEDADLKVVVSTANIFLQEQLIEKDLPFIRKMCAPNLEYALIKGRNNYVCQMKLGLVNENVLMNMDKIRPEERDTAIQLFEWASDTETGDKSEYKVEAPHYLWEMISATDEECIHKNCDCFKTCFSQRARLKAKTANIIVCNYHILLLDQKMKSVSSRGILPKFDYLICDEGHRLEEISRSFFGAEVGEHSCRRISKTLEDIAIEIKWIEKELFGLEKKLLLDLFDNDKDREVNNVDKAKILDEMKTISKDAKGLQTVLTSSFIDLFTKIKKYREKCGKTYIRTKEKDIVDIKHTVRLLEQTKDTIDRWSVLLLELGRTQEVELIKKRCIEIQNLIEKLDVIISMKYENFAYWIEVRPNKPTKIFGRPIKVGSFLQEHIWDHMTSSIVVSGTMASGGPLTQQELAYPHVAQACLRTRFSFNLNALGMPEDNTLMYICESPFNFVENCAMVICKNFPKPFKEEEEYRKTFLKEIQDAVIKANGNALILFTSYDHMEHFYNNCHLLKTHFPVYAQVFSQINRKELVDTFKKEKNSVLLGAASFWEGLDVSGEALQLLVIDKLPFPNKNQDPFLDALEETVPDYFDQEYLPRAIIKLKQGFGRLIRTTTDKGMFILADSRCFPRNSRYADKVFSSFPPMPYADDLTVVKDYFLNLKK